MNAAAPTSRGIRLPSTSLALKDDGQIAQLRHGADERKAHIRQNPTLSDSQRRAALDMLRRQTEEEMRRVLGSKEFNAFKAFHHWWFRQLTADAG